MPVFSTVGSNDFYMEVLKGNVTGYAAGTMKGLNADVDGTEDLWNQGGSLTRVSTAAVLYVSSSDDTDTSKAVTITGLDGNYDEITEVITTNATHGQTRVTGTKTFLRVNSVTIAAAVSGKIYVYYVSTVTVGVPDDLSKVQAAIDIGQLQAFNAIYTPPRNKNRYITDMKFYSIGSTTTHEVVVTFHIKEYGGAEVNYITIPYTDPNYGQLSFIQKPIKIPAKADFDVEVALAGGTNMSIEATFDYIDEDVDVADIDTTVMTKAEYVAWLAGLGRTLSSTKLYLIGLDEMPSSVPSTCNLEDLLNPGGITGTTSYVVAATTEVCFDVNYFTSGLLISTTKEAMFCVWRCVDSAGAVTYVASESNPLISLKNNKKIIFVAS